MVAPLDAKVTFDVEGEPITLHLSFRELALAKQEGVNLLSGADLDALSLAVALRCLAVDAHPTMTNDQALAIVLKSGEAASDAMLELFRAFGGSAEGNAGKLKLAK
jgi:hypothetical protein